MGCESNRFCGAVSANIRKVLCAKCSRKLLSAGSIENYLDTHRHALILLDGFITGTGYGDTDLKDWPNVHLSRTIVITPGYLAGFRGVVDREDDVMFASSFVRCETDCCIAYFDQAFLEELASQHKEIMHIAAENAFEMAIATSEFLSLALAPTMNKRIETLLAFLARYNLYCSETKIANMLNCSRTSVSRAFTAIEKQNHALYDAYIANKNRIVMLQNPA